MQTRGSSPSPPPCKLSLSPLLSIRRVVVISWAGCGRKEPPAMKASGGADCNVHFNPAICGGLLLECSMRRPSRRSNYIQNMLTSSNRIRPHAHIPAQSGSRPSIIVSVDQRLSQSAVVCSAPPRHPTPVCWCWYAHMASSTPRCLTRDTARRRCAERLQLLSSGQLHHGRAWIG
jgi:hypothetical protein